MNDNLIAEILRIEEEADNILQKARQKAKEITDETRIQKEKHLIEESLESEYLQKKDTLKAKILEYKKSEEEQLKNKFENLIRKHSKTKDAVMEKAISWIVKNICAG